MWHKTDDGWWCNPDTLALSLAACGLWIKAGSYCGSRRDPFISTQAMRMLGGTAKLAGELVAVGYWDVVDGGWQIHNWEQYQPDPSEREKWRERKRRQRDMSRDMSRDSHGDSEGQVTGVPEMSGSRARPEPVTTSNEVVTVAAKRGSRLPPDWTPPTELVEQMRSECPGVDLRAEHVVFVDYWIAQPGQKGVKTDWDATWRNWMRRKRDDIARAQPKRQREDPNDFVRRMGVLDAAQ